MKSERWSKNWCENCNKKNWVFHETVYTDEPLDPSGIDIDGFECRSCGHINAFMSDEELELHGMTKEDLSYIEKGKKKP